MSGPLPLKSGDIVFIATPSPLYRRLTRASGSKASHVGIVFEDAQAGWVVAESAVLRSRYRPLEQFLGRSGDDWFVVRRLKQDLTPDQVTALRAACDKRMGRWHHPGFKDEAVRTFSKFVHEVYRESLGMDIGEVETFSELLRRNPGEAPGFWKLWFSAFITRQRKTITPASQLQSARLNTIWHSGSPGSA